MSRFLESNEPPAESSEDRLDSWKEIAQYLRRDLSTVRRWERNEDLPIRRHHHRRLPTVYAYRSEIDHWWDNRRNRLEAEKQKPEVRSRRTLFKFGLPSFALVIALAVWWIWDGSRRFPSRILEFGERDWILITDFENSTGESVLDGSLEYALERELSSSRYVNVVPPERVVDVLRLMKKSDETPVDRAMGREICVRDGGIRAMVAGRVERIGAQYSLSIQLVDPNDGRSIAASDEEVDGSSELIPAMGRLATWLREVLGEALIQTQESEQDLAKVTTSSLQALQLFSKADDLLRGRRSIVPASQGGGSAVAEYLKAALAEDPEFAIAYLYLAFVLKNQDGPREEYLSYAGKGLDLVNQVSERERYFIQGMYHRISEDFESAVPLWEALVERYPDDHWGNLNLLIAYDKAGHQESAVIQSCRVADLHPNNFWINAQVGEKQLAFRHLGKARFYFQRASELVTEEHRQEDPGRIAQIEFSPIYISWLENNASQALSELNRRIPSTWGLPDENRDVVAWHAGSSYLMLGKLRAARQSFLRMRGYPTVGEHSGIRMKARALAITAFLSNDELEFLGQARQWMESPIPGDAILPMMMARLGLLTEAQEVIQRLAEDVAVKGFPQEFRSYCEGALTVARGELALARKQPDQASALFQEGMKLIGSWAGPEYFMAAESLAGEFERQGRLEEAIQVMDDASGNRVQGGLHAAAFWLRLQVSRFGIQQRAGQVEEAQILEERLRDLLIHADPDCPFLVEFHRQHDQDTGRDTLYAPRS